MRFLALTAWLFIISQTHLALADEFPYKATIRKSETEVRSGPGKNFYATDKLQIGYEVEVYRHDPGGWAAIRPPDGSFSWLRSRYLELGEDNLAKVNAEDVVARIGSSLVSQRDVIQVHLEAGELVELVDGDEDTHGSWRKIAPPSGEFRWVKLDALEATGEPGLLAKEGTTEKLESVPEDYVRVQYEENEGGAPALTPSGESFGEDNEPLPPRRRRMSHQQVQQEIVDLDLELSSRAAGEITTWQFDDLHARAERALEGAPTALDRAAVREIMNKIDRFEQLCDRHDEIQMAQSRLPNISRLASRVSSTPTAAVDSSKFDGIGRLTQITSRSGNTPQYALVDGAGTVRYYLNPSPGINLKPFLNKQVGVNGTRGGIAAKQRQILSAQRITELPGETRRY
jgi:SH3-like domain-containing protein